MIHKQVLRSARAAIAAVVLLSASHAAHAVLITTTDDSCGTAQRVASLTVSHTCNYESSNVNGTPKEGDLNTYFATDAPWTAAGEATDKLGTSGFLTVKLDSGYSWNEGPLTGIWQISAEFWATYTKGIISMHVGNGNGDPDWFFWELVAGQTSGTFSYHRMSGKGGGLSNLFLWGSGTPTTFSVPEPHAFGLLGAGLLTLTWVRRKQRT